MGSKAQLIVIPGSHDPTNSCLPQKPINRGLFPEDLFNLQLLSNPCSIVVGGLNILSLGSQMISDMRRYWSSPPGLPDLGELILSSRLIAPTAPDTLGNTLCKFLLIARLLSIFCKGSICIGNDTRYNTCWGRGLIFFDLVTERISKVPYFGSAIIQNVIIFYDFKSGQLLCTKHRNWGDS